MELTTSHIIGIAITLSGVIFLSIWSGRKVKSSESFTTASQSAGTALITGALMGTIIGGASTIGTAQMAVEYGFSALWFVIGTTIATFALALVFGKRMRQSNHKTIEQIIEKDYGSKSAVYASVLGGVGLFLNVVAQLLSATALLAALFNLPHIIIALIGIILMAGYVVFGGVKSVGIAGFAKMVLVYMAVLAGGITAYKLSGGLNNISQALPYEQYFNLFSRGLKVDLGAGLAVVAGILCTQPYLQIMLMGKDDKTTAKASFISALMIPPIGIGAMLVGMYMKIAHPEVTSGQAFPAFIIMHMPGIFGGMAIATLLITVVASGATLAFGISTVFMNNIFLRIKPDVSDKGKLLLARLFIIAVLVLALLFTFGDMQAVILKWSFLSMGFRASVTFLPMCGVLFFSGKIDKRAAIASIILSPLSVIISKTVFNFTWDPVFTGLFISLLCMITGYIIRKYN